MKKKLPIILLLLFLGIFIVACASPAEESTDSGEETTTEETTTEETTEEEPAEEPEEPAEEPEEEPMEEEAMGEGSIAVLLPDSASSARWEADDRRFFEQAFDAAGVELHHR